MNKKKLIISSAYASIITIFFVVVVTIYAELSAPLKDWLKTFSGHHWTSKSIFSVFMYIFLLAVFYLSLGNVSEERVRKALVFMLAIVAVGTIVIAAFYTGHHFKFF